jgi:hypothetical protein
LFILAYNLFYINSKGPGEAGGAKIKEAPAMADKTIRLNDKIIKTIR